MTLCDRCGNNDKVHPTMLGLKRETAGFKDLCKNCLDNLDQMVTKWFNDPSERFGPSVPTIKVTETEERKEREKGADKHSTLGSDLQRFRIRKDNVDGGVSGGAFSRNRHENENSDGGARELDSGEDRQRTSGGMEGQQPELPL